MTVGKTIGVSALIVFGLLGAWVLTRYSSLHDRFVAQVTREFQKQPPAGETLLQPSDMAHLPLPVRKYIEYTGSLGKPKVQNIRVVCSAQMIRNPNAQPMQATSVQYNYYNEPTRIFFMRASLAGLPFHALHNYSEQKATFVVRVLSLFNMVDLAGEQLTLAETVTVLNDWCIFAPARLIDPRLTWKEIDSRSAHVTFSNGPYKVSAVLYFNPAGELVNFVSEDRMALQEDGTLKRARWSTPLQAYKVFNGKKIASYGEAVWNYPEGDFIYGKFTIRDIQDNVKERNPED